MSKEPLKISIICLMLFSSITNTVFANFNDIDYSPVKDEIFELENLGIIHGYDDGNFYPDKMITRAEFIVLAATIAGLKDPQPSLSSYADIPQEHWANPYINYCDDKGWLREDERNVYFVDVDENGNETARTPIEYIEEFARYYRLTRNPDNITQLFEPDKNISYEDAVKLVVNILGYDLYAENLGYMDAAEKMGLIEDKDISGEFTREKAAELIYKALNRPMLFLEKPDPNVENSAYEAYIADGTGGHEYITLYTTFFEKADE